MISRSKASQFAPALLSLTISLGPSPAAQAASKDPTQEINEYVQEISKHDHKLRDQADDLCPNNNDTVCIFQTFKDACQNSPGGKVAPNYCIIRFVLYSAFYMEKCGPGNLYECAVEQHLYEAKLKEFGDNHAAEPGIGRAAANICAPFSRISVRAEWAQKLLNRVDSAMPSDISRLVDSKVYYECIKEQYIKLSTDMLKK